jgi:copper transport protein
MAVKESGALMAEFSTRAVWAVGAIVLSGVLITWTQVQSIGNLFGNDYAVSLLSKLGLFVLVLALAAYNKTALTPALERGDAAGAARIRTTIRAEYAVYILILGAAMTMTLTTPPRAIVAQGAGGMAMDGMGAMGGGFKTTVQSQGYSAEFDLSPAKAGENMLMVTVKDAGGNVLTGMADLELTAALESAGISDIVLKGEKMPNGMWHVMIKEMIIPGEWTLRVDAFVSDFDKVGFETKVQIK